MKFQLVKSKFWFIKPISEGRSESIATIFVSTRFSFKGTQIVCQKKVRSISISELLLNEISSFRNYLFPPFNKCKYFIIVKFYRLHLYPVSDRIQVFSVPHGFASTASSLCSSLPHCHCTLALAFSLC